jgi:hypothetical protein
MIPLALAPVKVLLGMPVVVGATSARSGAPAAMDRRAVPASPFAPAARAG